MLTVFKESLICDGTEKPCKGKTPYRHISRGKHVCVDGETRKVQISNSREAHPKPELLTCGLNAAASSSRLSFLEVGKALSWAGLNGLRGVLSNGRDFCGGKAHITRYSAFQLRADSAMSNTAALCALKTVRDTLVFPLTYAIQHQVPFQKAHCFCAGSAAEGEERGMWSTLSLESSHQPLTALCTNQVFLSRVCSCAAMCMKYSVSECEQARTPDTEDRAPRCKLKIVTIIWTPVWGKIEGTESGRTKPGQESWVKEV